MLFLKLTIVPLFIALVTLAGRRWGTQLAGLLAGLPVVAGPIMVILALEQGTEFGVSAAIAAIAAVAALLGFGIAYAWASMYWRWPLALFSALLVWFLLASLLVYFSMNAGLSVLIALAALLVTPKLLPPHTAQALVATSLKDLPGRMFAGATLTILVSQMAFWLGGQWSGVLAAFPIIGSILAVFTHMRQGAMAVAQLYYGMVQGFYSFSLFFLVLAYGWPVWNFWVTLMVAIVAALALQGLIKIGYKAVNTRALQKGI
ncbi:hypothetical protein ACF3NA_05820 [Alkanindiges sp. WGS2144]|uniref:hypothetical protein n=1 Tax=Alkanindiges sp. WGS2144 TaxID=3366808 RepID=UPI0037534A9D